MLSSSPVILWDAEALAQTADAEIADLTRAATEATFYREGLSDAQIAANRRIAEISAPSCRAAACSPEQAFAAAFAGGSLAGYMIATRHGPDDHELDWLMVHPRSHGTGVAGELMRSGMRWLGEARPMWLNVIRHNTRAIRFYERFGFVIDPLATTTHLVPHWIMRRAG